MAFTAFALSIAACNGGSSNSSTSTEATGTEAGAQDAAPATAAVYYCPMKCEGEKTYDQAGQCPVCGMDLVILENDASTPASDHEDHDGHEGHNH